MKVRVRQLWLAITIALLGVGSLLGIGNSQEVAAQGGFNFTVSDLTGHSNVAPTSLQFGPDDKLYVADRFGDIYIYDIVRNGPNDYAVTSTELITTVTNMENHDDDGTVVALGSRQVTGIYVAGTAGAPVLYVSSSDPRINDPGDTQPLDTNSGVLSQITQSTPGSWANPVHVDLIRGFPRNEENHSVNGMALSQDGNTLYLTVGGNTNMGAPSFNFAHQWEYAWSAAIVAIDLPAISALPTLTDPSSGYQYKYDLPTLDDPTRPNSAPGVDVGDPWGGNSENNGANMAIIEPNMPVTLHSVGWRNAYDVIIRQDGRMFSIDNGPNVGWGGPPNNEGPAGICDNAIDNGGDTINDNLHYVRELVPGQPYYAGHPNPLRGNPDDIYSSTLTTSVPFSQPPVPFTMTNPVECDYRNPQLGEDGSLENWPYSTNGLTEYTATNFGGALQGAILAAGWDSTNIVRVSLSFDGSDNPTVTASDVLFQTGGAALDVTALGDTAPFPGTVWVANLFGLGPAGVLRVYEPGDFLPCNGGPADDDDSDGYTNQDELDNGTDPCSAASMPPDFDQDFVSDLNDPDDDNDGILDLVDGFAIDAQNGKGTDLPADFNFDFAEAGFIGSPFTGLMTNGTTDYLDQFDPANMTVIGAAGVFTIDAMTNGDALGTSNDQDYAFQFGANTCESCYPFVAYANMTAPLQGITTTITTENMGFFIGTGDQSNYLKVVVSGGTGGTGGFDVVYETGDTVQSNVTYSVPAVLTASIVELFLHVDPLALTVQPAYSLDGAPEVNLGAPLAIPASWFAAPNALAVGLIGTAGTTGTNFTGTWTEVGIRPDAQTSLGSWTTLVGTVPTARHENAYVEVNGLFYLIGGRGINNVDIFDPATGVWSSGTPSPIELHHFQPVAYDDMIYIVGAMTGGYPNETPLSHVYIYDTVNDEWIQGMEIPVARRRGSGAAVVFEGKIYLAGGIQNGHISGTVGWLDEIDPRANTWTALPNDMPNPRDHVHGVVYDGNLYIAGGRVTTQPIFADGTVPEVDVYDFALGSWTTMANDLPTPRAGAMNSVIGNELIVMGGESDAQADAHAEVEALNLNTGIWRTLAPMPFGLDRHGSQAIIHQNYVYIAAGSGAQGGSPELTSQIRFGFAACALPTAGPTDSLSPTPADLSYGSVVSGTTSVLSVTVTNPGGNTANIALDEAVIVGLDAPVFSVTAFTPTVLVPGASTIIEVTFAPDEVRDFGAPTIAADGSAALAILHDGANSALIIGLSGTGTSSDTPISGLAATSNSPVELGNPSIFTATITAGTNVTYTWNFGDGTITAGGANITHTYGLTGTYAIVVTATNTVNSQSTSTSMVVTEAAGEVPITGLNITSNSPVVIGGLSSFNATITAGTNVTYTWNLGDGTIVVNGPMITHTYATTGNFNVVVTATNSLNNQTDSTTMEVIDPPPFASYINANGTTVYNGSDGTVWQVDNSFTGGATFDVPSPISGTTDDLLYQTERYGDFSYNIPVASACYDVTLHFAEIWFGSVGGPGAPGQRVFDVNIEGATELDDYDIFAAVGSLAPDVHTFEIQVTDGSLDIDFVSIVDNAKVSAIEVVYSGPTCAVPTAIGLSTLTQAQNTPLWGGIAIAVLLVFTLCYVYIRRRGELA